MTKKESGLNPEVIPAMYKAGLIAGWYLRPSQIELFELLTNHKKVVAKCHRRWGKGTTVLVYAISKCMMRSGFIVRYGGPTQKQAYDILEILFDHIYKYYPKGKPKLKEGTYFFENGSRIFVFGCKDAAEADKARGTEADLIIADEYAFWRYRPEYILNSVLSPQTDTTNGQIIITSTPPIDLTHPYVGEVEHGRISGHLFSWNIDDSLKTGEVAKGTHAKIVERCRGTDTDTYRREYLCEMIADKSQLVIPEASNEELWTTDQALPERPRYFTWDNAWDFGFTDYAAGLWAYLDFSLGRLIVVGEYFDRYKSTAEIVAKAKKLEEGLEVNPLKLVRRGDCSDAQQLYDMSHDHDYSISGIVKRSHQSNMGFKESVINQLRLAIMDGKILIDKHACPNTYLQLKYGLWNEKRSDFERTTTLGHLDALMALAYLVDNVDWKANPFPIKPEGLKESTHFIDNSKFQIKSDLRSIAGIWTR